MPPQRRSQRLIRRAHTFGINLPRTPSGNGLVPTEPSTPESPTLQTQGYRRRLRRQRSARFVHAVLHYDQVKRDLAPWYWCVVFNCSRFCLVSHAAYRPVTETGERVPPSDLLEYRRTHDFRGPCCLCASLDSSTLSTAYTEASIFVAIVGPCIGKYVAACATGQCRYWGKFCVHVIEQRSSDPLHTAVCIEKLYARVGLLVNRFPKRSMHASPSFTSIDLIQMTIQGMPHDSAPPVTPVSQSYVGRILQDVEDRIGPDIGLVTERMHPFTVAVECRPNELRFIGRVDMSSDDALDQLSSLQPFEGLSFAYVPLFSLSLCHQLLQL
jgi:hypothetical protein